MPSLEEKQQAMRSRIENERIEIETIVESIMGDWGNCELEFAKGSWLPSYPCHKYAEHKCALCGKWVCAKHKQECLKECHEIFCDTCLEIHLCEEY